MPPPATTYRPCQAVSSHNHPTDSILMTSGGFGMRPACAYFLLRARYDGPDATLHLSAEARRTTRKRDCWSCALQNLICERYHSRNTACGSVAERLSRWYSSPLRLLSRQGKVALVTKRSLYLAVSPAIPSISINVHGPRIATGR